MDSPPNVSSSTVASIWTAERGAGRPTFIGGHRGSSLRARENTLAAFELAISEGADFIETDLRLTRDGVPVAFHDGDLERLCGDPRSVRDMDFSELRAIHSGIATMVEVLDLAAGRVSVLLDTKIADPDALRHSVAVLRPLLLARTVAFGTRSIEASRLIRDEVADCPVLGLFQAYSDYPRLAAIGGRWARLWEEDASAAAIAALHALGFMVIIMAGKRSTEGVGLILPETLATLMQRGADAVMLNDVKTAVQTRRGLMTHRDFT